MSQILYYSNYSIIYMTKSLQNHDNHHPFIYQ